jgi:hypothetical protein
MTGPAPGSGAAVSWPDDTDLADSVALEPRSPPSTPSLRAQSPSRHSESVEEAPPDDDRHDPATTARSCPTSSPCESHTKNASRVASPTRPGCRHASVGGGERSLDTARNDGRRWGRYLVDPRTISSTRLGMTGRRGRGAGTIRGSATGKSHECSPIVRRVAGVAAGVAPVVRWHRERLRRRSIVMLLSASRRRCGPSATLATLIVQ